MTYMYNLKSYINNTLMQKHLPTYKRCASSPFYVHLTCAFCTACSSQSQKLTSLRSCA
ncbi:hypothetical protein Hanom_Chr03g00263981 [Helianthus anomalus]